MIRTSVASISVTACLYAASGSGTEFDASRLPPAATRRVDFITEVQPLFEKHCYKCHAGTRPKSGYLLTDRESALKGGSSGERAIVPGKGDQSPLLYYVARVVEDMEMPPEGKGEPLTAEQVRLIRAWIDRGAEWGNTNTSIRSTSEARVTTILGGVIVDGNRKQFRALNWQRDDWYGGLESFDVRQRLSLKSEISVEGHLLPDDYLLAFEAGKRDLGFARLGWSQFRKWYEDTGGYYAPFRVPSISLEQDFHMDVGRAWLELGLTLPDLPTFSIGYEHQYRDGTKSTLHWGPVTEGGETRNLFPAFERISERVHILRADLTWDPGGVILEDSFHGEWRQLAVQNDNAASYDLLTDDLAVTRKQEDESSFHGANTIRLEKAVEDRLLVSGGYLFSKLETDADVDVTTFNPQALNSLAVAPGWHAHGIEISRQSHVFSLGLRGGPWRGLTLSLAPQFEWNRQKGMGEADVDVSLPFPPFVFPVAPEEYRSDLDSSIFTQTVGMRYTGIRYTTLFIEGRFREERLGHFEEEVGGLTPFLRQTDTTSTLRDGRVGFNTAPWRRVSLNAHYRLSNKDTDYDNLRKESAGFVYQGYPAFFKWREVASHEIEARLAYRFNAQLKTGFGYKWIDSDYRSRLEPVVLPQVISPGGNLLSGTYTAHALTFDGTWTPVQRLLLSAALAFQTSQTATADQGSPSVEPYDGHIYSVSGHATYTLNHRWDLAAGYSFSIADFSQNNQAAGLPLGIQYQQHALFGGVKRKLTAATALGLQYRLYLYEEPSSGDTNNYQAHGVFATFNWEWL